MRKYSVQEASNLALGQLGFDDLSTGTTTGDWVAIKAVGDKAAISDITTSIGDDITTTGVLDPFSLEDGEILYAPITQIRVVDINHKLIAYRR
jgi:hypothetical protein